MKNFDSFFPYYTWKTQALYYMSLEENMCYSEP